MKCMSLPQSGSEILILDICPGLAAFRSQAGVLCKPLDPDHTLQTWFVLERCDGGSLATLLADRRRELATQHQRHSPNHPNHLRTTSNAINRKVFAAEYGRTSGTGGTAGLTDGGGCTAVPHFYTPPGSAASEVYGPRVTGAGAAGPGGAGGAAGSRLRRGSVDQGELVLAAAVAAAAVGGGGRASGAAMARTSTGVSSEQGAGAPGSAEVDGGGDGTAAAGRPVSLLPLVSYPVGMKPRRMRIKSTIALVLLNRIVASYSWPLN